MNNMKSIKDEPVTCAHCGADVPQVTNCGRVRLYCTPEHGRLWRRRARFFGWL